MDGARAGAQGILTYRVPERWRDALEIGSVAWVPIRKRWALGIVLRLHGAPPDFPTKPIAGLVEPRCALAADQIALGRWLARETASGQFAALAPFLPPGLGQRGEETIRLGDTFDSDSLTRTQRNLTNLLAERGEMPLAAARAAMHTSLTSVVATLAERGIVERSMRSAAPQTSRRGQRYVRLLAQPPIAAIERAPRQQAVVDYLVQRVRLAPAGDPVLTPLGDLLARSGADHSVIGALARKGIVEEVILPGRPRIVSAGVDAAPSLTEAQAAAWRTVEQALANRDATPMLLHGVTGSGKTEVYLRAIAWCLRHGRSAIVLVPEIALASQVVRRVNARFPGQVAVLHSALPDTERRSSWQAVADGDTPVVVGPRSALFAPVRNLGLIVLDEEHESAYKQDGEPRYHARAVAERIAADRGAVVLLGSATPAVETTWRAAEGHIRRLELPERVGPGFGREFGGARGAALELPPVEIVDMRLELHRGNAALLSEPLQETLERTLAANEQAMLLLNRRGLATVVLCRGCGQTLLCPYCDIPLVYHADRGCLLCHRCDHREAPPNRCQECGGAMNYFGAGTQRVEEAVAARFPGARVLRWDQDVVRRKGGHEALLHAVERHEVDIVVGTQMIAKGLDLPLVTAIGVINADTMLHLPDFRAAERTFQLLTQVAGRAGRRGPGSRVVIQSYTPDHYAVQAAARHDYAAFYAEEIDFRRRMRYPPFSRLVRYLVRDADEARCAAQAAEIARVLARHARARGIAMDLLGPTPAFAARVRGQHQWQIILRCDNLDALLDDLPNAAGWVVDIDPQSML
ncbi:MAG: primosomal protein N' [Thermomicrobiales bacterium]|nr:primosomal protein N' [Thermomicrobiales bacterium]